ncbi:hypothetical protein DPMN_123694 [Dreissena polymorpha]|uniref:Uncharacterized protein n=1 Tax=Dreissena polymorpha TaxID=45954 RepID=A0A9D4GQU7_DREPO|nr:hypothetical protein DPMN_123694 [Dreissena polymorpha]
MSLQRKSHVKSFYERDDVSQLTANKKSTITPNGVKKQIRLLKDDLKHVHGRYISEKNTISYTLFCQLRPFWVIKPKEKDHKTCLCRIHDNIHLKPHAAHTVGMVRTKDVNPLVTKIVCNETGMYRKCKQCKDKVPTIDNTNDNCEQVKWFEWKTRREGIVDKGKSSSRTVTNTIKDQDQGTREGK